MEIRKIDNRNIYEEIAAQIEKQIISGKLKPGDKLPSAKELSERFEVGRSTIREALSALKAKGLLEIRQGERSRVKQWEASELPFPDLQQLLIGKDHVLELLEARKALEIANAALAAEKRTDADLRRLERIIHAMSKHLGNEAEGERADLEFHESLAQATHNSIMVRLLETISEQMEAGIRETRRLYMYSDPSVSEQLWREHQDIYEGVREGDPGKAEESMRRHLFHVEQVLFRFLK